MITLCFFGSGLKIYYIYVTYNFPEFSNAIVQVTPEIVRTLSVKKEGYRLSLSKYCDGRS